MKLRILNFGIPATNDRIIKLENPFHPTSVSDFDAFVFDPNFAVSFSQKGAHLSPGLEDSTFNMRTELAS